MSPIQEALLLGTMLIVVALLAVFDIVPQQVAQYAPLAVVPLIIRRRRNACAVRGC